MSYHTKRRRLQPATEIDRQSADVVDVALQTAHSLVDMLHIEINRQNFRDGVFTYTHRPSDENAYQPKANKPVFRDMTSRHMDLHVEQIINGKDAELAALYTDRKFVRWALRRRLQPIGIAGQNSEAIDGSKDDPDLGIIKAGLQTIEAVGAVPGQRAVFEIPPLGNDDPRVGSVADGADCLIQTLYTRPYNSALVGETFHRAISHMIYDPLQWAAAMRGYDAGAFTWINAAKNQFDSGLFMGLMLVHLLAREGKIAGTQELGGLGAVAMIENLAQWLELTPDRGALSGLTADQLASYKRLKVNFARKAFFVPTPSGAVNLVDEFGYDFNPTTRQYESAARTADNRELLAGTPAADVVNMQVNHLKMSTAAFVEAVNEEERWVAGVYCSGSSEKGARKAIVSLGCAS